MIRKFIIFSFFWIYMLGCQNTDNHLTEPKAPMHELHIDGDVQFSAEISWSPSNDSLNTKILAENVGTDTAIVETGSCAFNIIAYNENREPVWYNRMANDYICTGELLIYNIAPKDTKHLADQMYLSGQNWYWEIPDGDWNFVIESRTEKGESISFGAHTTKIFR